MTIDERLAELGIVLPATTAPVANYVSTRRSGNLLYVSGHVSRRAGAVVSGRVHCGLCCAELIADTDPMPNMGGDPAIPAAYTTDVTQGLPQGEKDVMRFSAPPSGSFRIFCGVPGHGLSGMWIRFKVDPAATSPTSRPRRARRGTGR